MNGCLNVLWHFPFLGFLFAFFYALFGVLLCCTIILYPVGLGYFQIAQFLLTPFTSALVPRKDLDLVRPKERSTANVAYSTIIKILYIPFGLIAAIGALFVIVGEFLSIIGIPCGIVWFKALRAIFNPIDMVCVPKAVGDEIERIKAGDTLRRYKGEPAISNDASNLSAAPVQQRFEQEPSVASVPEVRRYDEEKLNEIVSNASMYKSTLVEDCRRELEIRSKSEEFMPKVREMDDAKLHEILAEPHLYSDELIYCCQIEDTERRRIVRERQEQEVEQARCEREKEEKAAAAQRAAVWKKQRPYVFAAIAVLILAGIGAGYYSHRKEQERLRMERIAAEERRVAEQNRIEEENRVEQRRAEEQRIAQQKQAEAERIAAERLKQEAGKIIADENYRRSVGAYLVGEYHEGLQGIVFYVDNTYKHGKVLSKAEFPSTSEGDWKATIAWCKSLGKKWRLPTIQEWEFIYKQPDVMSELDLSKDWYRSASSWSDDSHWRFHIGRGEPYGCPDNYGWVYARAVSEF